MHKPTKPTKTQNFTYLISFLHLANFFSRRRIDRRESFAASRIDPFVVYEKLKNKQIKTTIIVAQNEKKLVLLL